MFGSCRDRSAITDTATVTAIGAVPPSYWMEKLTTRSGAGVATQVSLSGGANFDQWFHPGYLKAAYRIRFYLLLQYRTRRVCPRSPTSKTTAPGRSLGPDDKGATQMRY
jgi:hypothetical protein